MRVAIFYPIIRKTGPKKENKADILSAVKVYDGFSGPISWLFLINVIASMFLGSVSVVSLLSSNKHPFCLNDIKLILYYL